MGEKPIIKILIHDEIIGTIQNVIVPEATNSDSESSKVTAVRIRFSREQVEKAFKKGLVAAANQQSPFDIIFNGDAGETIHLKNNRIISTGYVYSTTDYVIVETATLDCETITIG